MSNDPRPAAPAPDAGASYYRALYLAGLLGVLLVCFHWDLGPWSFVPFLIGVMGMVTGWGGGPLVLLIALAAGLNAVAMRLAHHDSPAMLLSELVLCMAVLTCVTAHYRLQGLTVRMLPSDPRARPGVFGRLLEVLYL